MTLFQKLVVTILWNIFVEVRQGKIPIEIVTRLQKKVEAIVLE